MIKQAKNFKDQIKQYWALIALPRPDGEQTLLHDGMKAKMDKMRKDLSPYQENIEKIRVIIPDRTSAQGFRIHEVVSDETVTKEIETAPKEVAEIVPEPKRKGRFRRAQAPVKEEVSVTKEIKVKPLEEKRGFHFPSLFGRRKDVVPMTDDDLWPEDPRSRGREPSRPIERAPAPVVEPAPVRAPVKKSNSTKSASKKSSASKSSNGTRNASTTKKKPAPKPKTEEGGVQ
jgi:hypothetical protein